VTAVDADFGQRVEHIIDRGEHAERPRCGLTESAEVQPDYIAFDGKCRPERAPHPTIGDAGMEKDDRQVTAPARPVVGDTGSRSRTRGHGLPSWRCEVGLAKHSAVERTTGFLAAGQWGCHLGGSGQRHGARTRREHWWIADDQNTPTEAPLLREMPGQRSSGVPKGDPLAGRTGHLRVRGEARRDASKLTRPESQADRLPLQRPLRWAKAAWTPSAKPRPCRRRSRTPGPAADGTRPAAGGTHSRLHQALSEVLLGCGCLQQEGLGLSQMTRPVRSPMMVPCCGRDCL
jgi:hypothetical protein